MEKCTIQVCLVHIWICLLLVPHCASMSCTQPQTALPANSYAFARAHESGDDPSTYLYVGGLFGVHNVGETVNSCGELRVRGLHNLEAFLWAVRTFKSRYPSMLSGVNVGALAIDSCSDSFHLLQQFANFHQCLIGYGTPTVNPSTLLAYVGPDRSGEAMELAEYSGRNGPPMVSHAATGSSLSNKILYPHFIRTVPSDAEQVKAIVQMLLLKDWKSVQLVFSDTPYGRAGKRSFLIEAMIADICVVNTKQVPDSLEEDKMTDIVDSLSDNPDTRAVVVFANEDHVRALLQTASDRGAMGQFTWFGTTAWATNRQVTQGLEQVAEGSVTLGLEADIPPEFRAYIDNLEPNQENGNPWLKDYWSDMFRCYFANRPNPKGYVQLCDDLQSSMSDVELDTYVPYTIQAVDSVLLAIDQTRKELCSIGTDRLCNNFLSGQKWQTIFNRIISLKRNGINVFNTSTGDPAKSVYDIHNYRKGGSCGTGHCYEQIGDYDTESDVMNLQASSIHTYDAQGDRIYGATSTCSHTPCTVCGEMFIPTTVAVQLATTEEIPDPTGNEGSSTDEYSVSLRAEPWVIPLIVLAGIGVLLVIILDIVVLSKIFSTPYMKHWRTMWLGQLLLVAILLCYLTTFAFIPTPTKATCGIIRFGVGVSYAMCFSVLLVKLLIVMSSESVGELKGVFQVLMFLFAWGVQIAVDSVLLVLRVPGVVPDPDDPSQRVCRYGDFQDHVVSLVYVMFLIVVCMAMSIKTHKIATNHREGVFIGLCAGFTIVIWLVWILVGFFYGDSSAYDPCLAFGLLTTATVVLFVMFLPKVRQLNSMGVEGIYAEDDKPDYAPSVVHIEPVTTGPPSVIGYMPAKAASEGSIVLIQNGELHKEPAELKPVYQPGPYALHLRHPRALHRLHQSYDTVSVQSAPMGPTYMVRRPQPRAVDNGNIQAPTRVLRMTNDLTGRKTPGTEQRTSSEFNHNVEYGKKEDKDKQNSDNPSTQKQSHAVADLGSL